MVDLEKLYPYLASINFKDELILKIFLSLPHT